LRGGHGYLLSFSDSRLIEGTEVSEQIAYLVVAQTGEAMRFSSKTWSTRLNSTPTLPYSTDFFAKRVPAKK